MFNFKKKFQRFFWDYLYNHPMMLMYVSQRESSVKEHIMHDLCSRISIEKMRSMLDEAEKSDQKYITLARLLEDNFSDNSVYSWRRVKKEEKQNTGE